MNLDSLTISALVDEFMDLLVGGRVQDVLDVDRTGYGLEIYANRKRHYLYLSADQQVPRVHIVEGKLRRGLYQPKQLGLMLRRYVEGSILMHVSQPQWERILFLDFEHPSEGASRIVIEPMERRANILLLNDQNVILDCVKRVGPEENSYRLSLPNHEYKLPPPLTGRFDPFALTQEQVEEILNESENPQKDKVARLLPRRILGFSPLVGREVAFRAGGDTDLRVDAADPARLHEAIVELVEPFMERDWQPGYAESDEDVEAYSVYPLTHLGEWHRTETISEAMAAYYGAAVGDEAYEVAKKPVQAAIEEGKTRYRAKIESMERGLRDQSEIEHLQQSGELILAYQYGLQPGQRELVAQYEVEGEPLQIQIDPELTPLENAQKYFDKYNRAKRAQASVPELIAEAKYTLDYILQLENDLQNAANWPDIDDVIQALQKLDLNVGKKKLKRMGGGGQSGPLKLTKDGYVIWVGRNSRQNEQVTFRTAKSDDIWLHARNVPGSHVIIRDDGRRIPQDLIEECAAIAAYYSGKRGDQKVDVDVTRIKYVKPIKSAGPGMVTYRNERTLTVTPQNEEILKDG
ncbi:MAG: NFACT family protein [Anaerolineae bacterium]|nr:NFACT family protein [Anaerolineae bacterium]